MFKSLTEFGGLVENISYPFPSSIHVFLRICSALLLLLIALTVAINDFKRDLYEPQRVKCYLYGDKCSFCSAAATHNNTPPGERFYSVPSLSLRGSMTLALFQEEAQPAFILQQKLNGTNTLWRETICYLLNVVAWSILLCVFPLFFF